MRRRMVLSAAMAGGVGVLAVPAPARADGRGNQVLTGLDILRLTSWRELAGQRVGVISNQTGVDRDSVHEVDLMHADDRVDVVAVFGPEHGFRGSSQAGQGEDTFVDPRTGITVYDMFGASQQKWADQLTRAGVATVVFDIQDVGARFYTFIWTMYTAMVVAARLGLRFVVLDRPNPIGGWAAGPMMTPGFTSGVGLKEIVQQHGMTVGELARFFNGEFLPADAGRQVDLTVVRLRGWRRDVRYADTDLPWVLPSPNMPTPDTAQVYVGTCMFEGTNASEGRGTTRPFELIGAPYLDHHWGDRLNALRLPGVRFREAYFAPTFSKHVGRTCAGVQVQVVDPRAYDPIRTGVAMLVEAKRYADFAWRFDTFDPQRPYWIDKLTGSPRLRTMIDAGAGVAEVVDAWAVELAAFEARRRRYLLYH